MKAPIRTAIAIGTSMAAFLGAGVAHADGASQLVGHWQGSFEREGVALPVALDFTVEHGALTGRFTTLEQRAMEYPFDGPVKLDGAHVRFEIGGGSLTLDGALVGDLLSGTLLDEGAHGTFSFHRASAPRFPYRRTDLTFQNGKVTLAGSLFVPQRSERPQRFPAVVIVHGSGPESRWGTARFYADQFARAGVATFIYDKRGSGDSGGDWRSADYDALADDALAAIRRLAARDDIDPARIGLFGHSQGGIIAPLAANRGARGEVAFIVAADTVAGPVYEQDIYRVRHALADEFTAGERERAFALYRLFIEVARGNKTYAELERASAPVKGERWYGWLAIPPRDHWIWAWYRSTGNIDTLPMWAKVHVPVLLVYGERDAIVPVDDSIDKLERALEGAGNSRYTSVIIPRAAHNLTVRPDAKAPFDWWRQAPGLTSLLLAWIKLQTTN